MRAIEVYVTNKSIDANYAQTVEGYTVTIFVDKIVCIKDKKDHLIIRTVDQEYYRVEGDYQAIKDMIAACYGAEDEED